ncbi:MAG: uracil-DNA glycosylase family protein [Alphaproteobacteria bacterium]
MDRAQAAKAGGTGDPATRLAGRIHACRICCDCPQGPPLPHEPRPVLQISASARICIAGQAPGTRVHASGRPFTDPSGVRLRNWLAMTEDVFYDAAQVAIVPMGFCFPGLDARGADKPPRKECAPAWHGAVMAQMPNIGLVLAVGQYAHAWHLKGSKGRTLTETVSNWRAYLAIDAAAPRVLPLPHPSWRNNGWLRRNPWFEAELLPELRRLVADGLG